MVKEMVRAGRADVGARLRDRKSEAIAGAPKTECADRDRLVIEAKAERKASGRTDRGAGEYAGKVDDVEAVIEIANVALKAHGAQFFPVEIEGSGKIDR